MGPNYATICRMYLEQIDDPHLDMKAKGLITRVFEGQNIPCFLGLAVVSERLLREGHGAPVLDEVPPEEMIVDLYGRVFEEIYVSLMKHLLEVDRFC